jgi:hypothetical protein|tara:strand:- start:247 stop:501 length:255 start_codon:yes stop_codon:yes gene_type:complete
MSYNEFFNTTNNKSAIISIMDDEILMLVCYQDGTHIGTIHYPDNNFHYVKDAANNFVNGILDTETVIRHSAVYGGEKQKEIYDY